MKSQVETYKLPKILNIAVVAWFLYMVGCATTRGLLVFFAADKLQMTENAAILLYAAFGALNSVISFAGGWFATNFFNFKPSAKLGLFCYGFGIILIGVSSKTALYLGLSLMAVGSGFYSPNINSLLSRSFQQHDPRRHSAFTLCYTSMNAGAFFGYFLSGLLKRSLDYSITFFLAGFIVFIGFMVLTIFGRNIKESHYQNKKKLMLGAILLLGLLVAIDLLLNFAYACDYIIVTFGVTAIAILTAIGFMKWKNENNTAWLKYTGLGFISIFFWSLYQLKASFLSFYIKEFVDRIYLGVVIPSTFFQALNPICMIFIGPILAALWMKLEKRGIQTSLVTKFSSAVILMGLAYIILSFGNVANHADKVNVIWVILFFFFMSLGEMIIAPTGYAMVGELFVDYNTQGILQGLWDTFGAIGYAFSGLIATKTPVLLGIKDTILTLSDDDKIYQFIGLFIFVAGCVLMLLYKVGKRK